MKFPIWILLQIDGRSLLDEAEALYQVHSQNKEVHCLGLPKTLGKVKAATNVLQGFQNTMMDWELDDDKLEDLQVEVAKASSLYSTHCEYLAELYRNLLDLEDAELLAVRAGKRHNRGIVTKLAKRYTAAVTKPMHSFGRYVASAIVSGGEEKRSISPYGSMELTKASLDHAAGHTEFWQRPRCVCVDQVALDQRTPWHDLAPRVLASTKDAVAKDGEELAAALVSARQVRGCCAALPDTFFDEGGCVKDAFDVGDRVCEPLVTVIQNYGLDVRPSAHQLRSCSGWTYVHSGALFVLFLDPSVLAEHHGDLSQLMANERANAIFQKSPALFCSTGSGFWTPPGWTTLVTGVDRRSEAALRSDKRKDVPHPFVYSVFYPVLDATLAKAASAGASKEIGIVLSRGLDLLPREGAPQLLAALPKFLAALQ